MTASHRPPVGVTGYITAGPESGRYVKVLDDIDESGGIFLLTCRDPTFTGEVWDDWVANWDELDRFLRINGWEIAWSAQDAGDDPQAG